MTITVFTHHLPGETIKDLAAAERDFYFDVRTASESAPKGSLVALATVEVPDGHRFTVRTGGYQEGDSVHQLSSFENARSVYLGATSKNGQVRIVEKGTEAGGEVLLHPARFYTSFESLAA